MSAVGFVSEADRARGAAETRQAKPPTAPSAAAEKSVDYLRLEFIEEVCDSLASYARSATEAAWRGDRRTLGVHLAQSRLTLIEALKTFNELSPESGGQAGPK